MDTAARQTNPWIPFFFVAVFIVACLLNANDEGCCQMTEHHACLSTRALLSVFRGWVRLRVEGCGLGPGLFTRAVVSTQGHSSRSLCRRCSPTVCLRRQSRSSRAAGKRNPLGVESHFAAAEVAASVSVAWTRLPWNVSASSLKLRNVVTRSGTDPGDGYSYRANRGTK